jgi:predicted nucleic acid-binding protein
MSAAFVLDCSIAMTWLFNDEATANTAELLTRLRTESALVPSWWFVEVTNVLALAERKKRIATADSAAFISDLATLDIERDDDGASRAFSELLPLCRKHQLTSYDALYLDLAMRRRLPLATLDVSLRSAAAKLSLKLLGR